MKNNRRINYKTLDHYNPQIERLIEMGYESREKYQVSKTETADRTSFNLVLTTLESPYIKRWEVNDEDRKYYTRVIEEGHSFSALDGSEMVAVALAETRRWNGTLWIWEFHVTPSHQRRGIGRQMMDILAEKANAAGLRTMLVETQSTNMPAIRFYRAAGFFIEGIDLSYYSNHDIPDGEVAIFMKRKIS